MPLLEYTLPPPALAGRVRPAALQQAEAELLQRNGPGFYCSVCLSKINQI